jgi:hypothetical protein
MKNLGRTRRWASREGAVERARIALGARGAENADRGTIHTRVAAALNWSEADARSFSLPALREMVRPVSAKLAHEIELIMADLCG